MKPLLFVKPYFILLFIIIKIIIIIITIIIIIIIIISIIIIIVRSVLQARNSHHFADPDIEERGLGIGAHSHLFKSTEVGRSSVLEGWGMHARMHLNPPTINLYPSLLNHE